MAEAKPGERTEALQALRGHDIVRAVSLGSTISQAAKAFNIKYSTAHELYRRELARMADEKTKQEVLQQELETLRLMQRGIIEKAISGDNDSIKSMIQIMKMRSGYLGLSEGIKVQIEVSAINEAIQGIVGVIDGEVAEVTPLRRIDPKPA